MKAYNVRVEGRVQGVSFRYYTEREAKRHGITGWVRNCADGCVEVLICGEKDQTQAMLSWLKHGPPSASVARIDIKETALLSEPTDFKVTF